MGSLLIVPPARVTGSLTNHAGLERTLSADPREGFVKPPLGENSGLWLDFGAPIAFDTLYVGFHTSDAGQTVTGATTTALGDGPVDTFVADSLSPLGLGYPYHYFRRFPARTSRFVRIAFNNNGQAGGWTIGVVMVGLAFEATFGAEWGAGRTIEDTGSVERLFGGGFGIDDGVAAGGYQWTFGDLNNDERRRLYQLVKDRRTTRSVLVVEDADQTDGLNERLHWGLFRKLEAYERLDPLNTKWSLQIGDWA